MLNLDIREASFWFKQAQKKLVTEQLKNIQATRIAMARDSDYEKAVGAYESQLREIELGKEHIIKESWDDLKLMGKRKKR